MKDQHSSSATLRFFRSKILENVLDKRSSTGFYCSRQEATIKKAAIWQFIAGLGITVAAQTYAAAGGSSFFEMLPFILWGLTPFILIYWCITRNARNPRTQALFIAVAILTLLVCAYAYCEALFIYPDAQSALVFLFIPLFLNIGLIVLAALAIAGNRLLKPHP